MKKIILNIILTLLIMGAVVGAVVWLLPVKVTVAALSLVQLLTLVIVGDQIKRSAMAQKHNETKQTEETL